VCAQVRANHELSEFLTLPEFESAARKSMDRAVYEFVAGGAGDEISLLANQTAFDRIFLCPRVLRDVTRVDPSITLFDSKLPAPILLAPIAYQRLMYPEGELATVRGAAAMATPFVVSTNTTVAIEELAVEAKAPLWFQLYLQQDSGFTRELIQRVEAAGCQALCVTVDSPVLGLRLRQQRAEFEVPPDLNLPHRHQLGSSSQIVADRQTFSNVTWSNIEWLRSITRIRLVLKGILHPEDAELAVQNRVDGIIVSNHGARNLDSVVPTIEALPAIAERVNGRIPVLVDGGIRRGTDVLKGLIRGATAVLIGRSYAYALSVGGVAGVARCLELLRSEFEYALALVGAASIAELDRSVESRPIWGAQQ
jgi:4-hydroxymandelate oxidase